MSKRFIYCIVILKLIEGVVVRRLQPICRVWGGRAGRGGRHPRGRCRGWWWSWCRGSRWSDQSPAHYCTVQYCAVLYCTVLSTSPCPGWGWWRGPLSGRAPPPPPPPGRGRGWPEPWRRRGRSTGERSRSNTIFYIMYLFTWHKETNPPYLNSMPKCAYFAWCIHL